MADQSVSNERKKELEKLDSFQENFLKAIAYAKKYRKQLGVAAGAMVLIVVVFSGIMYSFEKSENMASHTLSQVLIRYAKAKDPEKGLSEVETDFSTLFSDYANTAAGKLARLEYAKICYDSKKYNESFENYKLALDLFKDHAFMENFILMSLGQVSLAKKDIASARDYFSRVENSKTDLLKDEAQFSLGFLDEADGKIDDSRKKFAKIVSDYQASIYYPLAKSKTKDTYSK